MSRMLPAILVTVAAFGLLAAACGGDDGGSSRTIQIVQTDDACTPATIQLQPGEKVTFEVKNQSKDDKEVEGIEGTNIEELLVPSGRTRSFDYTASKDPGTGKIKCYVPGGSSTIIELKVGGGSTAGPSGGGQAALTRKTDKPANATVAVGLDEYKVTAGAASVASGPTRFVATNNSLTMVHELAVLRVKENGSFENTGEIEDLDPGASGEIVLDLPPGDYVLACLIVPGEAGSTSDHYQEGMHTPFTVE